MRNKIFILIILIVAGLMIAELVLRKVWGFEEMVLFRDNRNFEYIAMPNQDRHRFGNRNFYNEYSMRSMPLKSDDSCIVLGFGDSVINGGTLTDQDSPATSILIVVVSFIAPGIVILQTFIEPFYNLWTLGKIPFNSGLFSLLSSGVLIYAVIQPAIAVVIGNNLIKPQLTISFTAAAIMVSGLFLLIPTLGILGAGISLFSAECTAAIIYYIVARLWLREHSISWPRKIFSIALVSAAVTIISLGFLIWLPHYKWVIVSISMLLFLWNLWRFWKVLPRVASERARQIIVNLPVIRKMLVQHNNL